MSTRPGSRRFGLPLRVVVALGALGALFTMHGLAPTASTAHPAGGTTGSHGSLHHLLDTADPSDPAAQAAAHRVTDRAPTHRHADGVAHDHGTRTSTATADAPSAPPTSLEQRVPVASLDHHGCAEDGCSSNGVAQLIEACIVALVAAMAFGRLLLRRRGVTLAPALPQQAGRSFSRRLRWPPPSPLLSELCISRT